MRGLFISSFILGCSLLGVQSQDCMSTYFNEKCLKKSEVGGLGIYMQGGDPCFLFAGDRVSQWVLLIQHYISIWFFCYWVTLSFSIVLLMQLLACCIHVHAQRDVDVRVLKLFHLYPLVTTAKPLPLLIYSVEKAMVKTTQCASIREWELLAMTKYALMAWPRNKRMKLLQNTMNWGAKLQRDKKLLELEVDNHQQLIWRNLFGMMSLPSLPKDGLISANLVMMSIAEVHHLHLLVKTLPWLVHLPILPLLTWAGLFKCGTMRSRTMPVQPLAVSLLANLIRVSLDITPKLFGPKPKKLDVVMFSLKVMACSIE